MNSSRSRYLAVLLTLAAMCSRVVTWGAENYVFPNVSTIINVRNSPYNAAGNGTTDDTAALQQAITDGIGGRMVYIPNGTYRVTAALKVQHPNGDWNYAIGPHIVGQSRDGVIIKLDNNAAGFGDPNNANAVLWGVATTDVGNADSFYRRWHNFTVDTGNNAGAIAIRFYSNNEGILRNVRCLGNGAGHIGLDLGWVNQNGPLLVQDVVVDGFNTGIQTGWAVNSQTISSTTLTNCRTSGIDDNSGVLTCERMDIHMTSGNKNAILLRNAANLTLVEATIRGSGNTSAAIRNDGSQIFMRDVNSTGFGSLLQTVNASGGDIAASGVSEFSSKGVLKLFSDSPDTSLRLPVELAPDLGWETDTAKWVNVRDYGATDDSNSDDSAAFQSAIDAAASAGKTVVYSAGQGGGWYTLGQSVYVHGSVKWVLGLGAWCRVVGSRFIVHSDITHPVMFEGFLLLGNGATGIENASAQTVIVRSTQTPIYSTGTGNIFVEDVSAPILLSNPNARVWGRQLNPEGDGSTSKPNTSNNGGQLWMLGLKTEGYGIKIDTSGGGKTEVLGAFIYALGGGDPALLFRSQDSAVSFAGIKELNFTSPAQPFQNAVNEIRGSDSRTLSRASAGNNFWTLYTGYQPGQGGGGGTNVTVTATDANAAEPNDSGTFTFSRGSATSGDLVVNFTVGGTATSGTDYTSLGTTVTIPNGASSATKTVSVIDDSATEGSETVVVTLGTGSGYTVGSPSSATVNIADNDFPEVPATTAAPTIDGTVDAVWSGVSAQSITRLLSGASSGSSDISGTWKMLWDSTALYLLVQGTDDARSLDSTQPYEDDAVELAIDIGNDKATSYGANDFQYVVRADGTLLTEYKHNATTGVVAAGSGSPNYVLELKIPWSTLGATPATNQLHGIEVALDDDDDGSARDAQLSWFTSDPQFYANPSVLGTVRLVAGSSSLPTVTVSATDANAAEPNDSGTFTFSRGSATSGDLVVNFTVGGTATSGSDYTSLGTTVTIPNGASSATKTVSVMDDTTTESSETVIVTLGSGTGYTVGSPNSATVNIADNDEAFPWVEDFAGLADGATADTGATAWSSTRGGGLFSVLSGEFRISAAGGEGVWTSESIDISGVGAVAASVNVRSSGTLEASGTSLDYFRFYYRLSGGPEVLIGERLGNITGTVTITSAGLSGSTLQIVIRALVTSNTEFYYWDNVRVDPPANPTVTVTASDANAAEPNDSGAFTFSRGSATSGDLVVNFTVGGTATSGSDYTSLGTTVTIPNGATSATRTVSVIDDSTTEGSETVVVTLAGGAGYTVGSPSSATVTIADNDATPPGTGTGLTGFYFNNMTLGNPVILNRTEAVDFAWSGSPGTDVNSDNFSVRWTGQIEASESGNHTFRTVSDDGVRLWVNGSQVIDNWTDHAPTADDSGAVNLTAGNKYNVVMEFYENAVGAEARLQWKLPSSSTFVAIPVARLYNALPAPWNTADIGGPGQAGSAAYNSVANNWTVNGGGADIWSTSDQFRYVHQTSSGDCEIIARVTYVENTDTSTGWAKGGVMIRESTAANAKHAAVVQRPDNQLTFQWRSSTGGSAAWVGTLVGGTASVKWVRLVRSGNSFSAYYKVNSGDAWTQIGSTQTIGMASNATLGLCVTAHNNAALCTAAFESVAATP